MLKISMMTILASISSFVMDIIYKGSCIYEKPKMKFKRVIMGIIYLIILKISTVFLDKGDDNQY